jgi:hypothetical protein
METEMTALRCKKVFARLNTAAVSRLLLCSGSYLIVSRVIQMQLSGVPSRCVWFNGEQVHQI